MGIFGELPNSNKTHGNKKKRLDGNYKRKLRAV